MSVEIKVNGKKEKIDRKINISEFLRKKDIRPEVVTVELNDQIIDTDKYESTNIKNKDRIELVYYMGGGIKWIQLKVQEIYN